MPNYTPEQIAAMATGRFLAEGAVKGKDSNWEVTHA